MISGGRKGTALLLLKRMYFWNFMHNFQSLFCQSLYVHTILGLARGKRPIAYRKIGISKLFTHNFRPSFGLNLQKYIISGGSL